MQLNNIALVCTENCLQDCAHELAAQLKIPLATSTKPTSQFLLTVDNDGLSLRNQEDLSIGSLRVDFATAKLRHRQQDNKSQELLAKALGLSVKHQPSVWDVTAGLGQDGWILASLGCQVHLIERHPVVFALLRDGLQRAVNIIDPRLESVAAIAKRIQLSHVDGKVLLSDQVNTAPDIVYIDPMFPEKRKQAKAKKAMQYFQLLVGKDADSEALLAAALKKARFRVIVKRPPSAPVLGEQKPSAQVEGKTVRYDIYALRSLKNYLDVKNDQTR